VTRLSVNVNKVATVRNSRGGRVPSVIDAARVVADAGAGGITIHPRSDGRHITEADARELAAEFRGRFGPALEFNIEGDPRPDWVALVLELGPSQATLVPVTPGELTSHAGYRPGEADAELRPLLRELRARGVRSSLFVEADPGAIDWAAEVGADRIELYTEPFARAFVEGEPAARASLARYRDAALHAHARGLGVNAGHDLDHENLVLFREVPHLDEVSIGHALVSRALFHGLSAAVREYLAVLAG